MIFFLGRRDREALFRMADAAVLGSNLHVAIIGWSKLLRNDLDNGIDHTGIAERVATLDEFCKMYVDKSPPATWRYLADRLNPARAEGTTSS